MIVIRFKKKNSWFYLKKQSSQVLMKEIKEYVCFVSHFEISQTITSLATALVSMERPSMSRGALSWFWNVLTYNREVIEY
jgi:hypothetical protein